MSAKPKTPRLYVADDDSITLRVVKHGFEENGLNGRYFDSGDLLLEKINSNVEACVLDLNMPGRDGIECLKQIKKDFPQIEVIILTTVNQAAEALEAIRMGAFDYITKPFDLKELTNRVHNAMDFCRSQRERDSLRNSLEEPHLAVPDLGQSAAMALVRKLVDRIAPTNSAVLLTGPSGTGKTLLARCIHAASRRAREAFISVSCPSLPGELLESEMFGHEKGAFTGATTQRIGRVQLAERGTLFLDEIGELPLVMQTKLLTFLQDQSYFRIGGEKSLQGNVRIVAATNRDLTKQVEAGLFREDLYYRLNVLPIELPTLNERVEDIPMLVAEFTRRFASGNEQMMPKVAPDLIIQLQQMSWPGNVRELENTMIRMLTLRRFPEALTVGDIVGPVVVEKVAATSRLAGLTLAEVEKRALSETLELCGYKKAEAARLLGIAEKSIYNKMKRHGLRPSEA